MRTICLGVLNEEQTSSSQEHMGSNPYFWRHRQSILLLVNILLNMIVVSVIAQESMFIATSAADSSQAIVRAAWMSSGENPTPEITMLPKNFWRASWQLFTVQVIPWSFNKYVRKAEFADLTLESWARNLKFSSWTWDDNNFKTNQFAHPYHGNLYFNCFRSNGYDFWEAAPSAFVGSYMWETFGETHPPALNDFLNTSLGGIALGEALYRLSSLVLNNKARGAGRIWREISATAINPVRGFNRLINGEWTCISANPPDLRPSRLSARIDAGFRRLGSEIGAPEEKRDNEPFIGLQLLYGNPFEDYEKPFASFRVNAEIAYGDSIYLNRLQGRGTIRGWELKRSERTHHVAGVYIHYDYFQNSAFQYGGQSFSASLYSHFQFKKTSNLVTEIGLAGVPIGAVPEDYIVGGEGRDYDFTSGVGWRAYMGYFHGNWLRLSFGQMWLWLPTVNGTDSNHFVHAIAIESRLNFLPYSMGLSFGYFERDSNYKDYPDVYKKSPMVRLFLSRIFGFE